MCFKKNALITGHKKHYFVHPYKREGQKENYSGSVWIKHTVLAHMLHTHICTYKPTFFHFSCTVWRPLQSCFMFVCFFVYVKHQIHQPVTATDERRKSCASFLCIFGIELLSLCFLTAQGITSEKMHSENVHLGLSVVRQVCWLIIWSVCPRHYSGDKPWLNVLLEFK